MIKFNLPVLLAQNNMTQKALSKLTGIRPATIYLIYHNDIKRIEVDYLDRICKVLNCSLPDLMEYVEE